MLLADLIQDMCLELADAASSLLVMAIGRASARPRLQELDARWKLPGIPLIDWMWAGSYFNVRGLVPHHLWMQHLVKPVPCSQNDRMANLKSESIMHLLWRSSKGLNGSQQSISRWQLSLIRQWYAYVTHSTLAQSKHWHSPDQLMNGKKWPINFKNLSLWFLIYIYI